MAEGCKKLKVWKYGCENWNKTSKKHKDCITDHVLGYSSVFEEMKYRFDGK